MTCGIHQGRHRHRHDLRWARTWSSETGLGTWSRWIFGWHVEIRGRAGVPCSLSMTNKIEGERGYENRVEIRQERAGKTPSVIMDRAYRIARNMAMCVGTKT